jgi:hypothetical protein
MDDIKRVEDIIESIFNGLSGMDAIKKHGMGRQHFYKLLEKYPQLASNYARAEKASADMIVDDILAIADSDVNPIKARNQIDARKWIASKRAPKKYGDRLDVNIEHAIDLTQAIEAASKRIALPNSYLNTELTTQHIETIDITPNNNTGLEHVDDGSDLFD